MKRSQQLSQILMGLGAVIREQRSALSLTQEQLAQECGLHRTYISDLECGKRNITLGVLYLLSEALQLTGPELLERAEQQSRSLK